jgi:hypothetical protein
MLIINHNKKSSAKTKALFNTKLAIFSLFIISILCFQSIPTFSQSKKIIILKNGSKAIEYLPKNFNIKKRYPLLIALHGKEKSADSSFEKWKPVADNLNMILLCPLGSNKKEGYIRQPTDDRKILVEFRNLMDKKYNVDFSKSILAGFSRGGNFALETSLLYPRKFKNVICMFGYLNKNILPILDKNNKRRSYRNSSFYLITGKKAPSKKHMEYIHEVFSTKKIKNKLKIYPELRHAYPPALSTETKKIMKWMFSKKQY